MTVQVNGESHDIAGEATVVDLLRALGMDPAAAGVAVALNADVVARRQWSETRLAEGDRVEVIRATQGG